MCIGHHLMRKLSAKNDINIKHVVGKEKHADILTRALAREPFVVHRDSVMGLESAAGTG